MKDLEKKIMEIEKYINAFSRALPLLGQNIDALQTVIDKQHEAMQQQDVINNNQNKLITLQVERIDELEKTVEELKAQIQTGAAMINKNLN